MTVAQRSAEPRRLRHGLAAAIFGLIGIVAWVPAAHADLHLDITRGNPQPMPIAIPNFQGSSADTQAMGQNITQVMSADLERSGLFKPLDQASFPNIAAQVPTPHFNDWKLINAQALVMGNLAPQGDGKVKIEFRLWDVNAGAQLAGFAYSTDPGNWRRIAHIIADQVYEKITGEGGYFDTRIVYIAESGPLNKRVKRLAIMDQDGANNRYLTSGANLVLTPRFSPSNQEITYLSYARGTPRVFLFNIDTGQQEALGNFPGMTFAPRFSPDGNRVVFSLSTGSGSEIYTEDLRTRQVTKITSSSGAIDTSPCYSPDGKFIAFNSDRGGNQQLYVMNSDGSGIHRISFGAGNYATPVWSPRGDLIAFTKFEGNNFSIGVMNTDGSGERILTNGYLVEGPTWAPNGRVLMYFRQDPTQHPRLFSIDLTGANEREVVTPQDASDPAWSPLLP
jgi:TolB protein